MRLRHGKDYISFAGADGEDVLRVNDDGTILGAIPDPGGGDIGDVLTLSDDSPRTFSLATPAGGGGGTGYWRRGAGDWFSADLGTTTGDDGTVGKASSAQAYGSWNNSYHHEGLLSCISGAAGATFYEFITDSMLAGTYSLVDCHPVYQNNTDYGTAQWAIDGVDVGSPIPRNITESGGYNVHDVITGITLNAGVHTIRVRETLGGKYHNLHGVTLRRTGA